MPAKIEGFWRDVNVFRFVVYLSNWNSVAMFSTEAETLT